MNEYALVFQHSRETCRGRPIANALVLYNLTTKTYDWLDMNQKRGTWKYGGHFLWSKKDILNFSDDGLALLETWIDL